MEGNGCVRLIGIKFAVILVELIGLDEFESIYPTEFERSVLSLSNLSDLHFLSKLQYHRCCKNHYNTPNNNVCPCYLSQIQLKHPIYSSLAYFILSRPFFRLFFPFSNLFFLRLLHDWTDSAAHITKTASDLILVEEFCILRTVRKSSTACSAEGTSSSPS